MSPTRDGRPALPAGPDIAAIYGTHGPSAQALAEVIVHDQHLAADAVQDAFLSLWLLGAAYMPDGHRRGALLRTIVHHRAVDILRSRHLGFATVPLDEVSGVLVDPNMGPEDRAVAADEARRVLAALATLSPAKRQVLMLAYWEGHSHYEISCLLGIPLGTVKTRIRNAKRDLLQIFPEAVSYGQ